MSSESGGPARHGETAHRPPLRSMLFVPGTRTEWLPKAEASGADAVILDLEDAVAVQEKQAARARVRELLLSRTESAQPEGASPGDMALFVRVNPLDGWNAAEELRAVATPPLAGVVLPKVSSPEDVRFADRLLSWCEHEQGMPPGSIALVPLLETAAALRDAYGIGWAASRVAYLGAVTAPGGDVERAVGYRWSPEGTETLALRSRVLLDARASGAAHPVAGLWTHIRDLTGLRRFAEENRSLGYAGMVAVHPSHVPVINEVFSPGPDELARCARLIEAVRDAQSRGAGAVTFEGQMVDEAMAATAREVLELHRRRNA
ncbi:CoA ester lyase [Streptomyces albidus (ex Kaewkla and Franco 2022)]|uniref:HpcH/HpaI aldolase/citrate lyase family protein n=1 Tax=Streptomyces albidus (ex Kaewkla and Franco 2022) TaxID=722709 RepID=UPI002814B1BA|nr:CoA ester lyase [Streptomyces albidus (ex Kaewkla and Franco 2022)]